MAGAETTPSSPPLSKEFLALADLRHFDKQYVAWDLVHENAFLCYLMERAEPGAILLDVGAYKGDTCIPIARRLRSVGRTDVQVVAVDPEPQNVKFIRGYANRELLNIRAYAGVASHVHDRTASKTGKVGGPAQMFHCTTKGDVRTFTLDRLVQTPVHVIKIDVEGMEESVLKGATRTLRLARYVYIEMWSDGHYERRRGVRREHTKAILKILSAQGFFPIQRIEKNVLFAREPMESPGKIQEVQELGKELKRLRIPKDVLRPPKKPAKKK